MGHSGSNIFKWATLPPIFAILTVGVVRFLSDAELSVPVDPSLWAMTVLLFIVLTALYGLFILHEFSVGLIALQALAQGILLCPLALSRGAFMIQWIGVLLAVSGASALASLFHQMRMQGTSAAMQTTEGMESSLPVPFVVTNEGGTILNVSTALLKIAGVSREEAVGQSITALLDPGEPRVELGNRTWELTQQPMEGSRYYFQLDEAKAAPAAEPSGETESAPVDSTAGALGLIDPNTRLHTLSYAMTRMEEELYRTKRYGHPLSAALFRIAFPDDAEKDGTAQAAFSAYCSILRKGLRTSDTAALASERSLLMVFSECPKAAAELVLQRMLSYISALCPNFPVFYDITALHVSLTFEGTDNLPNAAGLLEQLNGLMEQKYSLQSGGAA